MTKKVEITLKHFEILEDVLSEIEESRTYVGEDKKALDELKEMFSYSKYTDFRYEVQCPKYT